MRQLLCERQRVARLDQDVLCSLQSAGGGKLRGQLAALRATEQPDGIDEADEAAAALERTLAAPPRLASPDQLPPEARDLVLPGTPFLVARRH